MKLVKNIALTTLVILIWGVFIGLGFMNGFLLKPITSDDTPEAFIEATKEKLGEEFVGNFAMVLIEDGNVSKDLYYSVDQPVNGESIFPVASISKWVTSFGIHKLVEQGKLDLDKPVNSYLTRWQLPQGDFDNDKVTVRKLLSHSSGLVDDLGYAGFALNEEVQTIEASLTKAADSPYAEGEAKVGYEPGSKYMYSGAAYTILQLLIEEVSGQPFEAYMQEEVLQPLGMINSTYTLTAQNAQNLVPIYKNDGTTRAPRKFTALAAAAFMTSTQDLSKFLLANIGEYKVLTKETISTMSKAETFINGTPVYGLGPHLYSQGDEGSYIIGHDGSGNDALNTAARVDLLSKSGIIVLETGNYNMASSIADEWLFWKAGIADFVVMQRNIPYLATLFGIGSVIIIILAIFIFRKKK